ncbi:MAG: nucleotidyltransferase [Epulopiscium sp.]|nr:nucleotidyltransferase [Candidatus Epulonipiscium sp.]
MQITGIITEYNPFHNGHLYHIQKAKTITNADYVIAVMSGNFVQRGEPAFINKWVRTQMALQAGVDLVIELPVIYATASAEKFAWGAIQLLEQTGIVNSICFGSEEGDLALLKKTATLLHKEPPYFSQYLKQYLDQGFGFATSRMKALEICLTQISKENKTVHQIQNTLSSPNNILGIEYLKALLDINSTIRPYTIKRQAVPYHSLELKNDMASATAIRAEVNNNNFEKISEVMPKAAYSLLLSTIQQGCGPVNLDAFSLLLQYILRTKPQSNIIKFMEIKEGLENRILTMSNEYFSISEMVDGIATKRYTNSRIFRELLHILLQIEYEDVLHYQIHGGPQYVRILGFRKSSQKILSYLKKHCSLPIISNTKKFMRTATPIQRSMLSYEIQSTDIYALGYPNVAVRKKGYDYTMPMIIVE